MRIIALDDEELALCALLDAIGEAAPGAEIHAFSSAEKALEFAKGYSCDIAFLDIEMSGMSGMELAVQLTARNPEVNIIFVTGHDTYTGDAFAIHASGYLTKPVTVRKIRCELEQLRRPVTQERKLNVHTFGNFEVYHNNTPLSFQYNRTKELLAYLIDRNGALCTNGEILAALFEDNENHDAYLRSLRKDLIDTLDTVGCADVIVQQRGKLAVLPKKIDCDYYHWLAGKRLGCDYRGEYMTQYSWAEPTAARLERADADRRIK